ncbi:MAG: S1C family serine protease [Chloroflexota bacterium]
MKRFASFMLAGLLALTVIFSGAAIFYHEAPPVVDVPTASGSPSAGAALNTAIKDAAAAAGPSVVKVESSHGLGSGVIIDARGYIVTNYHVVFSGSANQQPDLAYTVTLANGHAYQARIAGTDAPDDLAVLKISAPDLKALPFADVKGLQAGELVLAMGNPLGYAQSVTMGIVSTPKRTVVENGPAAFIPDMIQTSAPINPGNSGGALVDLNGRLVGIPTLAAADPRLGTPAQGIGFAIPSDRVSFIARQIIASGKVVHSDRPYLGLSGMAEITPANAGRYGLATDHGVIITGLVADGPLQRAGLRTGEVIVRLDGQTIRDTAALGETLARIKPGQRVQVTVAGPTGERTVSVTLGELPVG